MANSRSCSFLYSKYHFLPFALAGHFALAMFSHILFLSLDRLEFFSFDLSSFLDSLWKVSVSFDPTDLWHMSISLDKSLVILELLSLSSRFDPTPI